MTILGHFETKRFCLLPINMAKLNMAKVLGTYILFVYLYKNFIAQTLYRYNRLFSRLIQFYLKGK